MAGPDLCNAGSALLARHELRGKLRKRYVHDERDNLDFNKWVVTKINWALQDVQCKGKGKGKGRGKGKERSRDWRSRSRSRGYRDWRSQRW
jgi:hypothetical protein